MSKPKVAFYWCASCGGCEEAVVDLAESILDVVAAVDIVFWPVALDFKRADVEALADGEIVVSFINGAVRSSEQLEMVELLRKKSNLVIAFGSCAQLGGIPGLANTFNRREMFKAVYHNAPSVINDNGREPQEEIGVAEGTLTLPRLWDTVKSLDQVIMADYYLPGCPPPVKLIQEAVGKILSNQLPPQGSVLAPDIALCEECPHRDSKPEKISVTAFKRPHEIVVDPEKCLLVQGLLCMGICTREGCGAQCIKANMPCTGCMGPTSRVTDYGAKALSSFASMIDADSEDEVDRVIDGIVDPVGTFYRYSLPASLLHRSLLKAEQGGKSNE